MIKIIPNITFQMTWSQYIVMWVYNWNINNIEFNFLFKGKNIIIINVYLSFNTNLLQNVVLL